MSVILREEADLKAAESSELPCASVLIRLLVPPKRHGVPLSTDTLPVTEWETTDLVQPRPVYTHRGYNTSRCEPRQHELLLFKALVDRPPRTLVDAVRLVESGSGLSICYRISLAIGFPCVVGSLGGACCRAFFHCQRLHGSHSVLTPCSGVSAAELVSARFALEGWLKAQLQIHVDNGDDVPKIDRAHVAKFEREYVWDPVSGLLSNALIVSI